MASTAGIAPATSTFARWRSDLTELRGQMASVIGLAPIRPGLKGRLLDLLCIHGRKVVAEVGSAPTSPPLQGGANLAQLLGESEEALRCQSASDLLFSPGTPHWPSCGSGFPRSSERGARTAARSSRGRCAAPG